MAFSFRWIGGCPTGEPGMTFSNPYQKMPISSRVKMVKKTHEIYQFAKYAVIEGPLFHAARVIFLIIVVQTFPVRLKFFATVFSQFLDSFEMKNRFRQSVF